MLGPGVAGDEGQARLEHCAVCSLGVQLFLAGKSRTVVVWDGAVVREESSLPGVPSSNQRWQRDSGSSLGRLPRSEYCFGWSPRLQDLG